MAGWVVITLLIIHSLSRGLCSVSAKDVLGKTVSKTRRGALMGYSAGVAGVFTLAIGLYVKFEAAAFQSQALLITFLAIAAALWVIAILSFWQITEPAGSTEGGGNAIAEAVKSLNLLSKDRLFRQFVISRTLLLSVALVPPFYVILAQENIERGVAGFALLFVANGIAGSLSAPVWGKLSDRSSRLVMAMAAALSAALGIFTWYLDNTGSPALTGSHWYYMALFFLVSMAHGGVRLGRKVYLVDMATQETRAQYVAISNTVIGVAMLLGGVIGVLGDVFDAATVILVLSLVALFAALYAFRMKEVSG
jgi:predicted MFS family arabinose efflux permease